MKNIDFLPNRYRESAAARAALVKRWTIVLGITVFIAPMATYQNIARNQVVRQLALVGPQFEEAQSKSQHLAELQKELQLARGEAALLAWLNHPWPRSQILVQLHEPLPESARLTSIKLTNEPKASASSSASAGRNRAARRAVGDAAESHPDDSRPAAEKDLIKMHEQVATSDTVVTLSGVSVNTTELHTYVARLRTTGMFDKSELRSLESLPGQEGAKSQNFEIRVVLAPGHARVLAAESAPSATASATPFTAESTIASRP